MPRSARQQIGRKKPEKSQQCNRTQVPFRELIRSADIRMLAHELIGIPLVMKRLLPLQPMVVVNTS